MSSSGSSASVISESILKPRVTFVLGAPGSGKGTLCRLLQEKHGYFHLSIGDHLRAICSGSESLEDCGIDLAGLKSLMESHTLVPLAPMIEIFGRKVIHEFKKDRSLKFLIDGFPRSDDAVRGVEWLFMTLESVLFFDCSEDIAKDRFLNRKREDTDTVEVFDKRYKEFEENNSALLNRYQSILKVVNTSGSTEESEKMLLEVMGLKASAREDESAAPTGC